MGKEKKEDTVVQRGRGRGRGKGEGRRLTPYQD